MTEKDEKSVVKYVILGDGYGLIVEHLYNYLASGEVFGFTSGFNIDSLINSSKKRTSFTD